jgi:uncharacterized protein (TIGR03435 family)
MKKAAILVPLALLPVLAQQPNAQQAAAPQPRFELADVHVSPTAFWFAQNTNGQIRPGLISDGLYIYRDATLLSLIQAAYGVTEDMVSGGPSWLKSDLFDVVAKVPEGTTPANLKLMLQSLLADRFAMVVQTESRPAPRYVLAVGKGKSKLKRAAAAGGDPGCKQERAAPPAGGPDGQPSPPKIKASCHNMTSQDIANTLRQMAGGYVSYIDHDIIDSTNLEGAWDFDLEWTPPGGGAEKGPDSITIFEAVNKQLGLTLELRDVPLPLMAVKSVNRMPTPNAPEVATALVVPPPRFEVAIVKPVDPAQRVFTPNIASQFKALGTLRNLIAAAFQIQPNAATDKIVGLPKFADSQIWDVTAKFPGTGEGSPIVTGGRTVQPTQSVLLKMVQGLLADQFELKTHTENREITVYALTVDGKHKLTKADPSERSDCRPDPNAPKPFPNMRTMTRCKNITMAEFARNLEQVTGFFDHPIVDETGLEGGWDFMMAFFNQNQPRRPAPDQASPNQQSALPDVPEGLSPYDAVQKQLGVKLVKTKRSMTVIVVDHVDEKPIE